MFKAVSPFCCEGISGTDTKSSHFSSAYFFSPLKATFPYLYSADICSLVPQRAMAGVAEWPSRDSQNTGAILPSWDQAEPCALLRAVVAWGRKKMLPLPHFFEESQRVARNKQ